MNDIAYFAYLGKCTVCTYLRYNETLLSIVKVKKTRRREGGRAEGRKGGRTERRADGVCVVPRTDIFTG